MFYLIVAGSRNFNNVLCMESKLNNLLKNKRNVCIISGGAKGADTLAKDYALRHNYRYKEFPANWEIGNSAGYIRNLKMHQFISQYPNRGCVCFWDGISKGTQHNFVLSEQYNTPLRIIKF